MFNFSSRSCGVESNSSVILEYAASKVVCAPSEIASARARASLASEARRSDFLSVTSISRSSVSLLVKIFQRNENYNN